MGDIIISKDQYLRIEDERLYYNNKDINDARGVDIQTNLSEIAAVEARQIYKQWIGHQPNQNVILLSGAGTSYGIGKGVVKGKTLGGLWIDLEANDKALLDSIIESSGYPTDENDLESLLTRAYRTYELNADQSLKEMINKVENFITKSCSLEFEEASLSPHSILLNKLTKRKVSSPRLKVFTLNYDTLFEQAASSQRFTLIDGFSFSNPKVFYGHSYDHDVVLRSGSRLKHEDNFIKKVFHLYKLHGSVDWIDDGVDIIQYPKELVQSRMENENHLKRVLIYPRDSKFELSYEQPYFELIGRLQQSLRVENTLLITAGFSFCDKHIRSIILEALKQNPSLHLLSVTYPTIVSSSELQAFAKMDNRIMLITESFKMFAENYPDSKSFSNEDPLDIIVSALAKRINETEK